MSLYCTDIIIIDIIMDLIWTGERRVWGNNGEFYTHIKCAHCHDKATASVCLEERAALHVWFLHLTNTRNCLKDVYLSECSFCSQDSKCAFCLNCSCYDKCKLMFVVTPATFVFLTKQSQKKSVSPNTEKVQMKDASFVDLSPSAPLVTNVLGIVEGICRGPTAKILAGLGSKGFESKGCFDIEGYSLKFTGQSLHEQLSALHSLLQKQTKGKVKTQSSLVFYN